MKLKILFIIFCIIVTLPSAAFAVKVAPRISDREIIEKLAALEAGQAALRSEMKAGQAALRSEMKAGQAALRSEMKAGQTALRSEMKAGQAALGKRIDDMNQRISSLQTTMLALFSTMVALVLALFAYIAWDRRTMIKPVVERLEHLESKVLRELDVDHNQGSAISRLIKAMRELAKQDEKVATVLRNFSLL